MRIVVLLNGSESCPDRTPSEKEVSATDAGLDGDERSVLEISRFYFMSFASPDSHAWMVAIGRARNRFAESAAPSIAVSILEAVQSMRCSRISTYIFNSPTCPCCSEILSEHERQFIGILVATRCQRRSEAHTHAMLLCEGNPVEDLLERMKSLARLLGPRSEPIEPARFLPLQRQEESMLGRERS
ncbi:MAG: hypothetical protein AAF674_06635 [Pseudomonadota bacterium]